MMVPIYVMIATFIAFLWGVEAVIKKNLLHKYDFVSMMIFVSVVYVACAIVMFFIKRKTIMRDAAKIETADVPWILFLALGPMFGANLLYYYILKDHDSSLVTAMVFSAPAFTLIISYLWFKEKIDAYGLSGILCILLGVCLIANNDGSAKRDVFLFDKF